MSPITYIGPNAPGRLRTKKRDGEKQLQLCCPRCGLWADVDEDQAEGKCSVICPQCNLHETRDWKAEEPG